MSINLGNKKFKKLYKGDELIVQLYKGDEKIFEDFEAIYGFKFTIDTRLTQNGALTDTSKDVWFISEGSGSADYLLVDWGDGTREQIQRKSYQSNDNKHTYAEAGEYQIMVLPTVIGSDGKPVGGWLNGLTKISVPYKIKSIDTKYPENSFVVGPPPQGYINWNKNNLSSFFNNYRNLESLPDDLFDNVIITVNGYSSQFFHYMFGYCGANTSLSPFTVAKNIFDKIGPRISGGTAYQMFYYCFCGASGNIPADLFSGINTSGITDFTSAFECTFYDVRSPIPETLFDNFDTSSGTDFSGTFKETFSGNGTNLPPAHLFDSLNTSNGTNFYRTFYCTFQGCGSSLADPLPAGLFNSINTSKASSVQSMFYATFMNCKYNTGGTIPLLFPEFDLSMCTNAQEMFYCTFSNSHRNGDVIVPVGLFKFTNTSSLLNVANMFRETFAQMAYSSGNFSVSPGWYSGLDTSSVTTFENMFLSTFRFCGYKGNTSVDITGIFGTLNTSNGVKFVGMFQSTFEMMHITSIPAHLFDFLNTSNGTNFSYMFANIFKQTKGYVTQGIPAGLFDHVDTPNGTSFNYMFSATFYNVTFTTGTIPPGLFDSIDTSKGEKFDGMFYQTFSGTFMHSGSPSLGSTTAVIPTGLFDSIDTSNGTSFSQTFFQTFYKFSATQNGVIPAGLFSAIDISKATRTDFMFSQTFFGMDRTEGKILPAALFSTLRFSSSIQQCQGMFTSTFADNSFTEIPAGLFGNLNLGAMTASIAQYGKAVMSAIFRQTFSFSSAISYFNWTTMPQFTMYDVFQGETDFSWADPANLSDFLFQMFGFFMGGNYARKMLGNATDVLQHFTPPATYSQAAQTFYRQDLLTDYATIDNFWK